MSSKTNLKIMLLVFVAFSVVRCQKSGSNNNNTDATCAANQTMTSVGCLPTCGTNMVYYNNSCVSATGLATGAVTSCGVGSLQSQYGCLPQCGAASVIYNNQCIPVTTGVGGVGGLGGTGLGQANVCSGTCGAGAVLMTDNRTCLPQGTCGPCYGYAAGYCYIGAYAHVYYGY